MRLEFHTQIVLQERPAYGHICDLAKTEDRLYLCELMNIAAEEEDIDLFFAPLGTASKDGRTSELFYRTNTMPSQEDMECIFEYIKGMSKPNENVPFGIMVYSDILQINHRVFEGTDILDERSFNFDKYNQFVLEEDFEPSPAGPFVNIQE